MEGATLIAISRPWPIIQKKNANLLIRVLVDFAAVRGWACHACWTAGPQGRATLAGGCGPEPPRW